MIPLARNYDVIHVVCTYLTLADQAALVRTSSELFEHIVRFLWREVRGIPTLLGLIPGARFELVPEDKSLMKQNRIMLPLVLNLTRFRTYAAHVKTLVVPANPHLRYYVNDINWSTLVALSKSSRLLPNLASLVVHWDSPFIGPLSRPWHTLFLSSSLIDFQTVGCMPPPGTTLSLPFVSDALHTISKACPDLQSLQIFPFDQINFLTQIPNRPYQPAISAFRELRKFTTSLTLLQPEPLSAIGGLPYLRALSVYASGAEPVFKRFELSNDSFPSLHSLEIHDFSVETTRTLWTMLPLVSRLTHVGISHSYTGLVRPWVKVGDLISKTSLQLDSLVLEFRGPTSGSTLDFLRCFYSSSIETLTLHIAMIVDIGPAYLPAIQPPSVRVLQVIGY